MDAIIIVTVIALFLYSIFIFFILYGLTAYKKINLNNDEKLGVSVIVAVRNGEKSLPNLLYCLSNQNYQGPFEIIIVDDQSNDSSVAIIQKHAKLNSHFKFQISDIGSNKLKQKKRALDAGIKMAKYDNLLFTDVDCHINPSWIKTMASYFTYYDYLVGYTYVNNKNDSNFVTIFQSIDLLMMMIVGKAFFGLGIPFGAIGQNQGFTKKLYKLSGGFESIQSFIGDDTVFLQHCKKFTSKIGFVDDKNAYIQSRKEKKWKNLFFQRVRWASDANKMWQVSWFFFCIFVITFVINSSILYSSIVSLVNYQLSNMVIGCMICKFLLEISIYSIGSYSLKVSINYIYFIFWFIIEIPYVVLMGVLSFFSHYLKWKGRRK